MDDHLEVVKKFLDENVKVYPQPKKVKVANLTYDPSTRSGEFDCYLDEELMDVSLEYYFELGKNPHLRLPMFYSPCGAPASYSQIELTWKTRNAILKAVEELYLKNFGNQGFPYQLSWYEIDTEEDLTEYQVHYSRKNLRGSDNFDFEIGKKTFDEYSSESTQVHVKEDFFFIPELIIAHILEDYDRYETSYIFKIDGLKIINALKDVQEKTINKNYATKFIDTYCDVNHHYFKWSVRRRFVHHPKGIKKLLLELTEYLETAFEKTDVITVFGL